MDYNNRQVQNLYHPDLQQKRSHSHIFRYAKKKKKKSEYSSMGERLNTSTLVRIIY